MGHSAGGYYAQLYAELYPSKIKSLSLLSSMIPLNTNYESVSYWLKDHSKVNVTGIDI